MPVFLSHKREDKPKALEIANYLKSNDIYCYIDVLDSELQTTDDITKILMKRVKQCTHLMAVVSDNTQKSWWVSFEIGVASELDKRITSFKINTTKLPEFLEKWPILKYKTDLDLFIDLYKKDKSIALEEAAIFDSTASTLIRNSDQFHNELKQSISLNQYL